MTWRSWTNPSIGPGMEKLRKEVGKIRGYPGLTLLTIDAVKKSEPAKQDQEETPMSGSGLGGFLAKAVAKKVAPKDEPRSTVMTSANEILSLSPAVAEADVVLPAGYRQK